MNLSCNLHIYSPGMQFIDDAMTYRILLRWLDDQLSRMGLRPEDIASICCDNATNISKALASNVHLRRVQQFCFCYLINVAVKRATSQSLDVSTDEPLQQTVADDEDDSIDEESRTNTGTTADKGSSKFWYYEPLTESTETDNAESISAKIVTTKRKKRPSKKLLELIEQKDILALILMCRMRTETALLVRMATLSRRSWEAEPHEAASTRNMITDLISRCRKIAITINKSHTLTQRLNYCRKQALNAELDTFRAKLQEYHAERLEFEQKVASFKEEKKRSKHSRDSRQQAPWSHQSRSFPCQNAQS